MIKIIGNYYDGCSSLQTPVDISFYQSGEVLIKGEILEIKTTIDQLKIAPRLGNTQRNIFLSQGAKLETLDNAAVDQVCTYFDRNRFNQFIHKVEKNWPTVILALFITIIFVWGGIEFGVPVLAKGVAKGIPHSVELSMGQQGLESLDKWLFSSTEIDKQRQAALQQRFKQLSLATKSQYQYQLVFRNSQQMGANALALPGGIVIVTDGLVELAENDQQFLAVLAHEMGHIENQHGIRSILQNSMTALFMAGLLGDIASVSSLSVTLPTILVESRFSREFELEADRFAVQMLPHLNIKVEQFIKILTLLERPKSTDFEFDYLSSHPAMSQRIETIQGLQRM